MQKIGKLYLELGQNMSPLPGTTVDLIHDFTCKVASKRPDQFSLYGAKFAPQFPVNSEKQEAAIALLVISMISCP